MTSLRFRLTLTYLAVILVGMGLAALLAWLSVERLYVDAQKANLLAQAHLVATALQATPQQSPTMVEPYAQTANVLPGIHTRVIEEQGAVVIDLPELMPTAQEVVSPLPQLAQNTAGQVSPDELLNRPEMAQALSGQPATAIRRVAVAEGRRVLYAAVPVWSDEGQVSRIVYIASPLPDTGWGALPVSVRWRLAGAILLAITLAMAVGWWLARRISGPLNALAGAASRVAQGDLGQTVPEDASIAEMRDLGRTFNLMTASLRHADQVRTDFEGTDANNSGMDTQRPARASVATERLGLTGVEAARLLGISRAHFYKLHSMEQTPRPVRLGRSVRLGQWGR